MQIISFDSMTGETASIQVSTPITCAADVQAAIQAEEAELSPDCSYTMTSSGVRASGVIWCVLECTDYVLFAHTA